MTEEMRRDIKRELEEGDKSFFDENFRGADLSGGQYRELRFYSANLSRTNLCDALFEDCVFVGGGISEAQVKNVRMVRCEFIELWSKGLNWEGARFESCVFQTFEFRKLGQEKSVLNDVEFLKTNFLDVSITKSSCQRAGFLRCQFVEGMILESDITEADFSGSRFLKSDRSIGYFLILSAQRSIWHGVYFEDSEISGCDFTDADFCAADLSGVQITLEDGESIFTGAKYNSQTKFPPGFDPAKEGMVQVADFSEEEYARLTRWREEEEEAEESREEEAVPRREGVFVRADSLSGLICDQRSLALQIGGASWPPSGYEGCEEDAKIALKLERLLKNAIESSFIDSSYVGFVSAPGVAFPNAMESLDERIEGSLEAAADYLGVSVDSFEEEGDLDEEEEGASLGDDDDVDAEDIFLWFDREELKRLRSEGMNWWKKFWTQKEYKARVAAGKYMAEHLRDYLRAEIPYGEPWCHRIICGESKSGATVGVVVVVANE